MYKWVLERSNASEAEGARSIKLLDILRKMTEEARRQPRAVLQLQHCVYLDSYSWGEGKEQQSSNRATESLFLVLFAVGSFETPSPSLLTGEKEQRREKTNGNGPKDSMHVNIKKKNE